MSREDGEYFQAKGREIIYNKIIAQTFPKIYEEIQETLSKSNRKKPKYCLLRSHYSWTLTMQKNENIEICGNHLVAIKGDPLKSQ